MKKQTSRKRGARTGVDLGPVVRISDLWVGDRFVVSTGIWTYMGAAGDGVWATARKHSPESIALGKRSYGYIGDPICSFKLRDKVRFVALDNPNGAAQERRTGDSKNGN